MFFMQLFSKKIIIMTLFLQKTREKDADNFMHVQ